MQLAAIARVRWQLFVHSLRTTKGSSGAFLAYRPQPDHYRRGTGRCGRIGRRRMVFRFRREDGMARAFVVAGVPVLAVLPGHGKRLYRDARHLEPLAVSSGLPFVRSSSTGLRGVRSIDRTRGPLARRSGDWNRYCQFAPFSVGCVCAPTVWHPQCAAHANGLCVGGAMACTAANARDLWSPVLPRDDQFSASRPDDEPVRIEHKSAA